MTVHNDNQWRQQYEQLVKFKQNNGHCVVPRNYDQDKSLGKWVSKHRALYNNNTIRQDRKRILDAMGFFWNTQDESRESLWNKQYEQLVKFKKQNGHCMVPGKYKENKSLGNWVQTQRNYQKQNIIPIDRKRILDKIGFAWNHTHDYKICHQNHALLETEPTAQGHRKRPISTCLAESGRMAASTNKRDKATGISFISVEEAIGRHEKDPKPSAVTSSAVLIGSSCREVVQEEATHGEIPSCWKVLFPI
jgi:hypothetical protein